VLSEPDAHGPLGAGRVSCSRPASLAALLIRSLVKPFCMSLLPNNVDVDEHNKPDSSLTSAETAWGKVPTKTEACTPEHVYHAFDALYCALTDAEAIPPSFPNIAFPLFVTWYTKPSRPAGHSRLRGCIGTFEARPVREGLAEYALISAFNDSRFRKIREHELEHLECGISLLTDFEDASSYLDWTIGVHGIHISFPHPSTILSITSPSSTPSPLSSSSNLLTSRFSSSKRSFSATYLPEVIPDQGWSKVEAVDSAIQKAGWNGHITEDLRRAVKLRRYQSSKYDVTYEQYMAWRERYLEGEE